MTPRRANTAAQPKLGIPQYLTRTSKFDIDYLIWKDRVEDELYLNVPSIICLSLYLNFCSLALARQRFASSETSWVRPSRGSSLPSPSITATCSLTIPPPSTFTRSCSLLVRFSILLEFDWKYHLDSHWSHFTEFCAFFFLLFFPKTVIGTQVSPRLFEFCWQINHKLIYYYFS